MWEKIQGKQEIAAIGHDILENVRMIALSG